MESRHKVSGDDFLFFRDTYPTACTQFCHILLRSPRPPISSSVGRPEGHTWTGNAQSSCLSVFTGFFTSIETFFFYARPIYLQSESLLTTFLSPFRVGLLRLHAVHFRFSCFWKLNLDPLMYGPLDFRLGKQPYWNPPPSSLVSSPRNF